jgi:putative tricarboxylic transport membrane protein
MSRLVRRATSLLFLAFSIILAVFVIPYHTEAGFGGPIAPSTLPTTAAVLIGLGAVFALFEPAAEDQPDYRLLRRALVFVAIIGTAVGLIALIGFRWTAPLLSLAIMMMAHERRLVWLAVGVGCVPVAIWIIFDILLVRPLP